MSDAQTFVRESEALAGRSSESPAHLAALEDALELGRAGDACPAETLSAWCLGLALGVEAGAIVELAAWLATRFADQIGRHRMARGLDPGETAAALAEVIERVGKHDGRLARLACAYATELCARPFFAFTSRDAEALGARDPARLRLLLAGKLRVAVYDLQGRRAEWTAGDAGAGRYTVPGEPGELIVEWHELQAAEARWAAEVTPL